MIKVKTFACPLKIFHAREELEGLDISEHGIETYPEDVAMEGAAGD